MRPGQRAASFLGAGWRGPEPPAGPSPPLLAPNVWSGSGHCTPPCGRRGSLWAPTLLCHLRRLCRPRSAEAGVGRRWPAMSSHSLLQLTRPWGSSCHLPWLGGARRHRALQEHTLHLTAAQGQQRPLSGLSRSPTAWPHCGGSTVNWWRRAHRPPDSAGMRLLGQWAGRYQQSRPLWPPGCSASPASGHGREF